MKKLEWILIANAVVAFVAFLFDISLSAVLLLISVFSLAQLYMFLSFALLNDVRFKEIFKNGRFSEFSDLRLLGSVLVGLSSSFTIIGILFKLMHWPMASVMILSGLIGILGGFSVSLVKLIQTKLSFYKNICIRLALLLVIAISFYSVPTLFFEEIRYKDHPEYIKALKEYHNDPSDPEKQEKFNEEYEKLFLD